MAVHPHGVMTWNHVLFATDSVGFLSAAVVGPRRDLAASVLFRIPLLRDLLLALGCVDAGLRTCHRALKAGLSLQLYVGGEREQLLSATARESVVVAASRRGFVRLACEYDVPIVPVYVFGEDRLYSASTFALPLRLALAHRTRVAIPLAWGRWGTPWPKHEQLLMVVGKPMRIAGEGTSNERVERGLRQYCAELTALYDRHRGSAKGYEDRPLKIV